MATNRLEDARRALMKDDPDLYGYILDFVSQRCWDNAGNLASGRQQYDLANTFWNQAGRAKERNEARVVSIS